MNSSIKLATGVEGRRREIEDDRQRGSFQAQRHTSTVKKSNHRYSVFHADVNNSRQGARLLHSLHSDVLFDRSRFADRHAVLRAARDTPPSAQGLPRVCQDSRRPGFHPHVALVFHSDLDGDRPVEESTLLQRVSPNRRVDAGVQSFSGIVASRIEQTFHRG